MPFVASTQQTIAVKHPSQSAGRISSTRKTEDVNVIAVVVHLHQIAISIQHIRRKSGAEGQTFHLGPKSWNSMADGWITHRTYTRVIIGDLVVRDAQSRVELDDV